jgi:hypothetical protein
MDLGAYQRYLESYVKEAVERSDGTTARISEILWSMKVGGFLTRQRAEKQKAIDEARKAFDDHRHWPVEIILSHLGIQRKG